MERERGRERLEGGKRNWEENRKIRDGEEERGIGWRKVDGRKEELIKPKVKGDIERKGR